MVMMSKSIGKWLLGLGAIVAFLSRQKITFGVKGIYLNGVITPYLIPLKVVVYLANKTIGKLLVRSVSGILVSDGKVIAKIDQAINKRIRANSYIEQSLLVDINTQETLQAWYSNIQSGDVNNLSFELIGEVVVGEQWPVSIKFNKVFTWQDIQQML